MYFDQLPAKDQIVLSAKIAKIVDDAPGIFDAARDILNGPDLVPLEVFERVEALNEELDNARLDAESRAATAEREAAPDRDDQVAVMRDALSRLGHLTGIEFSHEEPGGVYGWANLNNLVERVEILTDREAAAHLFLAEFEAAADRHAKASPRVGAGAIFCSTTARSNVGRRWQ